jgi:hypothetical protein
VNGTITVIFPPIPEPSTFIEWTIAAMLGLGANLWHRRSSTRPMGYDSSGPVHRMLSLWNKVEAITWRAARGPLRPSR